MSDGVAHVRAGLLDRGVGEEEIDRAIAADQLHLLVVDRAVVPEEPCYTAGEIADLTGMPEDQILRLWLALGFPAIEPGARVFTDRDLQAITSTHGLLYLGLSDTESMLQLSRVIGMSMARIAGAEVDSSPVLRGEITSTDMAELFVLAADAILPDVARLLEFAWRRHLQAALRSAALRQMREGVITADLAIGFADLVGFTVLSQQLSEGALAEVVGRFETLAHETVTSRGGRVVKMIGDEVMFSMGDVADAASVALALSAAYAADEMLSDVRVGLAWGPVLLRDGDCFGSTVNLASRIVNIAAPGSVVVAEDVYRRLDGDSRFRWRSLRPRYLKDIGRVPLWVLQQPGTERQRRKRWWLLRDTVREQMERAHAVGKEVLTAQSELDL